MEDDRIWAFEESLWKADAEYYCDCIDENCLMVVPAQPFVLTGMEAADAVSQTPRWETIAFSDTKIARPEEGLIVIAYAVEASRADAEEYRAHCTSTYRRLSHENWRVVQHQQTPRLTATPA